MSAHQADQPANAGGNTTRSLWPTLEQLDSIRAAAVDPITQLQRTPLYFSEKARAETLRIYDIKEEFHGIFIENQVFVIATETGTGKTTQVPTWALTMLRPSRGQREIFVTRPRKVDAYNAATQVAKEQGVPIGTRNSTVGYRFSGTKVQGRFTVLTCGTEGTLVTEMIGDPTLSQYGCIIIDEAHERNVDTDIIMAKLKIILKTRKDLRVIIMSATINTSKVARYFGDAPVIDAKGSSFPVEVHYLDHAQPKYLYAALNVVLWIHKTKERTEKTGDILVFVPGEGDTYKLIAGIYHELDDVEVLPLCGTLSPEEQKKAVHGTSEKRRIIVATVLASKSLTINKITYVVDTGLVKRSYYNPRLAQQALEQGPTSVQQQRQMAGRCGRTHPGEVFCLYTRNGQGQSKEELPSLLTDRLHSTILWLKLLGCKDIWSYDFLDPPAAESMLRAWAELRFLDCVDESGEITGLGRQVAMFRVEVPLAVALCNSHHWGCSEDVVSIVSMLATKDIFIQCGQDRVKKVWSAEIRSTFSSPHGDAMTLLNIWKAWKGASLQFEQEVKTNPERQKALVLWCQERFIHPHKMDEVSLLRDEMVKRMESLDMKVIDERNDEENIGKALLSGLFLQIAVRSAPDVANPRSRREYIPDQYNTFRENQPALIDNSSSLYGTRNDLVMYNEYFSSARPVLTGVSVIESTWLIDPGLATAYEYIKQTIDDDVVRAKQSGKPGPFSTSRMKVLLDYAEVQAEEQTVAAFDSMTLETHDELYD